MTPALDGSRPGWRSGGHASPADDYRFHVLDLPAPYTAGLVDWGMARHDPQNSGWTAPIAPAGPHRGPVRDPAGPAAAGAADRLEPGESAAALVGRQPARREPTTTPRRTRCSGSPRPIRRSSTYTLSFLVTDGVRQCSRSMSVAVVPNAIYSASMDSDPNWTLDRGLGLGRSERQGLLERRPEPPATRARTSSATPSTATTPTTWTQTRYATTGPIDCTGYKNIRLSFWRWLGVEAPVRLRLRPGLQRRRDLDGPLDDRPVPRLRRRLAARGVRGPGRRRGRPVDGLLPLGHGPDRRLGHLSRLEHRRRAGHRRGGGLMIVMICD